MLPGRPWGLRSSTRGAAPSIWSRSASALGSSFACRSTSRRDLADALLVAGDEAVAGPEGAAVLVAAEELGAEPVRASRTGEVLGCLQERGAQALPAAI